MVEVLRTRLAEFKAITSYVTDCERARRHALLNFEKEQRRRKREQVNAVQTAPRPANRAVVSPSAALAMPVPKLPELTEIAELPDLVDLPEIAYAARE